MNYTGKDNLEIMKYAKNYNRHLLSLLNPFIYNTTNVLDFGAGSGFYIKTLIEKYTDVLFEAVEIDVILNKTILLEGIECVQYLEDVKDKHYDLIYSFNVLEHIEDDVTVLKKLLEKLSADGIIFIYVPAFEVLYSSMDEKVGHHRRYTKNVFKEKLKGLGLRIEMMHYVDSLGFFASLVYKYIGSSSGEIDIKSLRIYDKYLFPISKVMDLFCSSFFGKNLLVILKRDTTV